MDLSAYLISRDVSESHGTDISVSPDGLLSVKMSRFSAISKSNLALVKSRTRTLEVPIFIPMSCLFIVPYPCLISGNRQKTNFGRRLTVSHIRFPLHESVPLPDTLLQVFPLVIPTKIHPSLRYTSPVLGGSTRVSKHRTSSPYFSFQSSITLSLHSATTDCAKLRNGYPVCGSIWKNELLTMLFNDMLLKMPSLPGKNLIAEAATVCP